MPVVSTRVISQRTGLGDAMRLHGRWLTVLLLLLQSNPARGQLQERCGTAEVQTTNGAIPCGDCDSTATFQRFRPGAVDSHVYRDIEFGLDVLLAPALTQDAQNTLFEFARTVVTRTIGSPVATDALGFELVHEYFRREGASYTRTGSTPVLRLGLNSQISLNGLSYSAEDRGHADVYINDPRRRQTIDAGAAEPCRRFGGAYPAWACYSMADEDVTSGRAAHHDSVRWANSFSLKGPAAAAFIDLDGTGWTRSGTEFQTNLLHELQHSLPPSQLPLNNTELWSAAAEAVTGVHVPPTSDFDYTAPFTNEYQARTAFMAYVAYNFLNADTARTLAGMRDDLLYRWNRIRQQGLPFAASTLYGLERVLADDSCHTCLQKQYFRPGGDPLMGRARVGRLIHNWRTAMFVDSPSLAEGQFGWPTWSGFSPASKVGAWTNIDTSAPDAVVMPSVAVLTSANRVAEARFSGIRSAGGASAPMSLRPMGAEYWVLRAGADIAGTSETLHVKIAPIGVNKGCPGMDNPGGRLQASAVLYGHADTTSLDASILWRHPEWASGFVELQAVDVDTVSQEVNLSIPGFGSTHKAVLVVLTLVDTDAQRWELAVDPSQQIDYRLDLKLSPIGSIPPFASIHADPSRLLSRPTWSPDGQRIAFSAKLDTMAFAQVWHRDLSNGALVRLSAQAHDQFDPDWSPRGDYVVYTAHTKNPTVLDIWRVGTDGSGATRLTAESGVEMLPAIQPNGQGIAYVAQDPSTQSWSLRWVSMSGYGDRLVAPIPGGVVGELSRPRWSKDGRTIYLRCLAFGDRLGAVPSSGGTLAPVQGLAIRSEGLDIHPGVGPAVFALTDSVRDASPTCGPLIAERLVFRDSTGAFAGGIPRFNREGLEVYDPRYSPDGTRVVFSARGATGPATTDWVRVTSNKAPRLTPLNDIEVAAGSTLSFTATATDSNGTTSTFEAAYLPSGATFSSAGVFHWLVEPGQHFIVFRAIDPEGAVSSQVVRVHNPPPGCAPICGDPGYEDPVFRAGRPSTGALRMAPNPSTTYSGNSFLDGAEAGDITTAVSRIDGLHADAGGQYRLRLSTLANGGAFIDRLRLHLLDHPSGSHAFMDLHGASAGVLEPAVRVSTETGADLLPEMSQAEGALVEAGRVLDVEWSASQEQGGILVRCRRTGATTSEGIDVRVPDGLGWRSVGRLHPRRLMEGAFLAGVTSERVRLVFTASTRLESIGRLLSQVPIAQAVAISTLVPLARDGDGNAVELVSVDGTGLELAAGASENLRFAAPAAAAGMVRSAYLEIDGRYEDIAPPAAARREAAPDLPLEFAFGAAVPNPSSGLVAFAVDLPITARVTLEILDVQGRLTRVVIDERREAGRMRLRWDGLDSSGQSVRAGVYYARFRAGDFRMSRHFALSR